MNCIHFVQIHTSDNLFCLNSFSILEFSVKFASQICHENNPLDGAYLVDFAIDIKIGNDKKVCANNAAKPLQAYENPPVKTVVLTL